MFSGAVLSFLHFIAAFGVVATVFCEWLTLTRTPNHAEAIKLQRCDMAYGLFAMALLVVGFLRVFYFEKGGTYYFSNYAFWTKLALFAIVGLLSIYPTVQFLAWRKDTQQGRAPTVTEIQFASLRLVLRLELILLAGIVFFASMMAKGVSM